MTTIAGAAIKVDDERDITSVIKKGLKSKGF
jgi:hypothetical protein